MNFLSSFLPSIPDLSLSKRAVKFVLQQAFGTFLSTDIDLDQLSLDLGTGKVELKSAELNVDVRYSHHHETQILKLLVSQ